MSMVPANDSGAGTLTRSHSGATTVTETFSKRFDSALRARSRSVDLVANRSLAIIYIPTPGFSPESVAAIYIDDSCRPLRMSVLFNNSFFKKRCIVSRYPSWKMTTPDQREV
jgi:hypothetical protein